MERTSLLPSLLPLLSILLLSRTLIPVVLSTLHHCVQPQKPAVIISSPEPEPCDTPTISDLATRTVVASSTAATVGNVATASSAITVTSSPPATISSLVETSNAVTISSVVPTACTIPNVSDMTLSDSELHNPSPAHNPDPDVHTVASVSDVPTVNQHQSGHLIWECLVDGPKVSVPMLKTTEALLDTGADVILCYRTCSFTLLFAQLFYFTKSNSYFIRFAPLSLHMFIPIFHMFSFDSSMLTMFSPYTLISSFLSHNVAHAICMYHYLANPNDLNKHVNTKRR